MKNYNALKKLSKGFISLLLVLTVMVSLAAPFDIVKAIEDEEPARGSEIHAILYYIDKDKKTNDGKIDITKNLELVFQRGGLEDSNKKVFKHFDESFADKSGTTRPWTDYRRNVTKVDIKDKIAPTRMDGWFLWMDSLTSENLLNIENIDTSNVTSLALTFENARALTELDLSTFDVSKVTSTQETFCGCYALRSINVSNWDLPIADYTPSMFSGCSALESLDLSGLDMKKASKMVGFLSGCTNLKSIKLGKLTSPSEVQLAGIFRNCSSLEEIDLTKWVVPYPGTFMEMFLGCKALKKVDFGSPDNWGPTPKDWTYNGWKERAYQFMFQDCISLESLDLTCVKGALICSSMFIGCTNLREINLGYAGIGKNNVVPDLTGKDNIFEGCDELSWIKLSADGWPSAGKAGTSIPEKGTWKKIAGDTGVAVGTELSNTELFGNFNSTYEGTWAAQSKITFHANGGTPTFQTVNGIKDDTITFDESEFVAERNGYDFDGWYSDKKEGTRIRSGNIASQWNYYAHWKEHKYTLVLDGNGGTVPADYSGSGVVSDDRKTITFSNISYTQFKELNKQMFFKNDDSVLASWNTRKNGKGTSYYANDSVNKLAEAEGATATLFAQWHQPEAIIKFNSEGGSEIDQREYSVGDTYGDLSESYKTGYTFIGWYTEPNELGEETKIESDSVVIGSQTLHAKWEKNPVVTFNANGGRINGETTTTKVCSYGYKIGSLPVPNKGSATLKGWYTAASGGTKISDSTVVTNDVTYCAQWGYKPKFETNGGSFTSYDADLYTIHDGENAHLYTITELPVVEKDYAAFDGWYFGNTKVDEGDTLDLSSSNVIKARWIDAAQYTVTFKYNDGETSDETVKVYGGNPVGQLPSPKRSGYNFDGWYDADDFKYESDSPAINSDITLTAQWTKHNVTVEFDPCGGTMVDSDTITIVGGKTLPRLPGANYLNAKGDIQYRFGGWYTEENGGGELLTTNTVISENKKYYAKWIQTKTQSDDYYVYSIHWATISNTEVTNTGGHLVFHPTVKGAINARLYISIEKPNGGTLNLPANKLEIKIPAHLFESEVPNAEENNLTSFFNASDDDDLKAKYSDDGKSIILYNPSAITMNTIITPEFSINPTALKGGYTDENGYYKGDYYQKTFDVSIDVASVTEGETTIPAEHYSRTMGLELHTNSNTTVSKTRTDVSLKWNSDWGTAPVDANEYFYVVWNLTSNNSNCTQPYKIKWSEDTIHDGTVIYADPPLGAWSETFTADGVHTAQIVTKHRKADVHNDGDEWAKVRNEAILSVEWNNEYIQTYRAARTAEVYVPQESSGSFSFAKNIPDFDNQNAHSINGGQELILNGEPELMPLLYEIGYAENVNTDNPTWNADAETYKTTARKIVIEDGADGDVMLSTDYGASSRTWDSEYIKALNHSDYYFSELNISLTEHDAMYLDGKWTNPYVNTDVDNYGDIIVYAKTAGSDKLEIVKTLRGVNSAVVTLPKNTVYYKVEHTSDYFSTKINVNPTLYLTDSNRVRSLVSDDVMEKKDTIVLNKCRISTQRGNAEPVVTESNKDGAWRSTYLLNISSSTLYAAKNCSNTNAVYEEGSTEECPVVISGWNYNNSTRGYKKYVKSGVFNDLLPKDCTVDRSTVFVKARKDNIEKITNDYNTSYFANYYNTVKLNPNFEILDDSYFSVEFKDNWQDSGRTMMTVTVAAPEGAKYTGFDVFYKLKTTHSNINTYGINLINAVSFTDTTNGQSVPDSRVGKKTVLDAKSGLYYNSIDSPQTAFATAKTNLKQPVKYQFGADSSVKAEGSIYSKHEVVGLNTDYNYNVTYAGGDTNRIENIIVYDVIEKQIDGPVSEWHGTYESLDLSAIRSLESANGNGTCNPVVYYSTKPKDDFTSEDLDITKTDIWTTVKPNDDEITAIAIDCRKTATGDFILDAKKVLSFNINLHSPAGERKSELETYNEAVIDASIVDIHNPIQSKARTGVTLRFANPTFVKTAFPESGTVKKPESVVQGSVLEYILTITNPDKELEMNDIVLEDVFSNKMKFNNTIQAKLGSGDNIPISQFPRVSSYSVVEKEIEGVKRSVFTATIKTLSPGETIAITIPVTVTDNIGTPIDNKARVTSINGVDYNVESGETHHVVSENKVKVLKVNGKGKALAGATLQILDENKQVVSLTNDGENYCTSFTSTNEVIHFNITPGTYYLHEVSAPSGFNTASDVEFSIDDEGIITVGDKEVSYVSITDTPKYKVIFHEGKTDGTAAQFSKEFRVYEPNELNEDKSITHFYDIPSFAGDEYVFAGWYHNSSYTETTKANVESNASAACVFEDDKYPERNSDYHIYAKWIKVGTVSKDSNDANLLEGSYRGFGLAGVQIRPGTLTNEDEMYDSNFSGKTHGGMRFVTSLSEDLLRKIDNVSTKKVTTEENKDVNVEYGFVAASKENIDAFTNQYKAVPSEYTLQYRGENVNGVNTLGVDEENRNIKTDYRYIMNVNCTSNVAINGEQNGTGIVAKDHRNFSNYRLYTLVITYDKPGEEAKKGESVDARAYIRYYDANGKLRVFYNNYNKTQYYGGCMCSYNQVAELAIPQDQELLAEQQKMDD